VCGGGGGRRPGSPRWRGRGLRSRDQQGRSRRVGSAWSCGAPGAGARRGRANPPPGNHPRPSRNGPLGGGKPIGWERGADMLGRMPDVTQLLDAAAAGDLKAAAELLPLVYDELRKLAAARLAEEKPGQTLQATALVHEAYLRLVDVDKAQHWNSRGHFF